MTIRRKVQKVIDGDTFTIRKRIWGSQRIRIAGKNAPERGRQAYLAKRRLSRLRGKVVTLKPVAKSYGRTVAYVRHKRRKV